MAAACGTVALGSWPGGSIGEDSAVAVTFGLEFETVPTVVACISTVDASSSGSKLIDIWTSDETQQGFRLHARTWGDAATYGLKVAWVASIGPAVQTGRQTLDGAGGGPAGEPRDGGCEAAVAFARPFCCAPDAVFGLSGLRQGPALPLRLWPRCAEVQPRGFAVRQDEAEAAAASAKVALSWVACAAPGLLQCGFVDAGSRSAPVRAGQDCTVEVQFGRAFDAAPSVAVALAGLDAASGAGVRVEAAAEAVTGAGFRLRVRSWADSVTYGARIAWVACPSRSAASVQRLPPHQPPAKFLVEGPPLGEGWCAVTHKVRLPCYGQIFAVKTSRFPFSEHEQALRQELMALERLPPHANLLRLHESILQADRLHLVTEYLDALAFTRLVPAPEGTFSTPHAAATILRWMYQLLDGLAHMHGVGLVHRDLHGENVLVERAPDGGASDGPRALRIIDFGAAGRYDEPWKPRLMSHEAGHFRFFSPERRLRQAFDGRDDVWAAGCHVTELASGRFINLRPGCGDEGVDFALAPDAVRRAISDCECLGGSRCKALAAALLVERLGDRPRAAAARDAVARLLAAESGKRPSGPSGGVAPAMGTPRSAGSRRAPRAIGAGRRR